MTLKTQTLLLYSIFLHCTELNFVYTTWPVVALVSAMSMMVPTLASTWSLLLTTPGATLPVSPPSLQPGSSSSRARAETSSIHSSEVSSLLTCSYREKSFWISFWKSFSLISDFSPCRTASKSWYLQLELQKHYRTFCTSFAQSGINVFSEYWWC